MKKQLKRYDVTVTNRDTGTTKTYKVLAFNKSYAEKIAASKMQNDETGIIQKFKNLFKK